MAAPAPPPLRMEAIGATGAGANTARSTAVRPDLTAIVSFAIYGPVLARTAAELQEEQGRQAPSSPRDIASPRFDVYDPPAQARGPLEDASEEVVRRLSTQQLLIIDEPSLQAPAATRLARAGVSMLVPRSALWPSKRLGRRPQFPESGRTHNGILLTDVRKAERLLGRRV
jgi:hypothetical protein